MKNQFFTEEASGLIMTVDIPHKAVALKYPEGADLPFITAKGRGETAKKMLELARENNVHIEENAPLVDILSAKDVNDAVPEEAFSALAAIFAFVLEREGRA